MRIKRKKKSNKKFFMLGKLKIPVTGRLGLKSKEWQTLRKHCEKRDGGKKCIKDNADCYGAMHLHHKQPVKDGGTNRPKNLAWLCHLHHCLEHPFLIKKLITKVDSIKPKKKR